MRRFAVFVFVPAVVLAGCGSPMSSNDGSSDVVSQGTDAASDTVAAPDAPMAAGNSTCAGATALQPGAPVTAQAVARGGPGLSSACVPSAVGKTLYYRISVPAGQTVVVVATPTSLLDAVIRFIEACPAVACLDSWDSEPAGTAESGHWSNTGTTAVDVIVAVSAYTSDSRGAFDLTASLAPSPSNLTCATAISVTSGTPVTAQDLALAAHQSDLRCLATATGPELFYSIGVPAGQRLTVTATPTGTWNPVVRVFSSCTDTVCQASSNAAPAGASEMLVYPNSGTAAVTAIVAIGSELASSLGRFDATFVVGP